MKDNLESKGYLIRETFLSQQECEYFLRLISDYRGRYDLAKIHRPTKHISLSYSVIDGIAIKQHLIEIQHLYKRINQYLKKLIDSQLSPLSNIQASCNVNVLKKGETYRWHYDRNAVTVLLYLNEVEGGEIDFYPNYRIRLPKSKVSHLQNILDQILMLGFMRFLFGQRVVVKPQPGLLLVIAADKCLHSVSPVTSNNERINFVMTFDSADTQFSIEDQLDTYLYSDQSVSVFDPNYLA